MRAIKYSPGTKPQSFDQGRSLFSDQRKLISTWEDNDITFELHIEVIIYKFNNEFFDITNLFFWSCKEFGYST